MHNYGRFLIALVCDIKISKFLVVFDYLRLVKFSSEFPGLGISVMSLLTNKK